MKLRLLRWMLVVPSGILGWYLGMIVAMLIYKANQALCPARYLVSGVCAAPWSIYVEKMAFFIGGGVVGALVVLLPALMAPNHRKQVALIAYGLGLACSIGVLLSMFSLWNAVLPAVLAGGWVLWRIHLNVAT